MVLKIAGTAQTRLKLAFEAPRRVEFAQTLGQLAESNEPVFTADFPHESALVNRVVFEDNYRTSFTVRDSDAGKETNWYYVRVVQANGQMAWSSPIWVEKA